MKSGIYSLIDLIRDEDFITWVRRPTPGHSGRWEKYLEKFPGQASTLELARNYINLIAEDTGRDIPTMKQSRKMWEEVKNTIKSENSEN